MAQLDRALASEAEDRRFESFRARKCQSPPGTRQARDTVHELIVTERLDLVLLEGPIEQALLAGDRALARSVSALTLPDALFDEQFVPFLAWKRTQVDKDSSFRPWSVRLVLLRDSGVVVGTANFHGPPGINDTSSADAAEFGYAIFDDYRGRGFATEIACAFLGFARREFGVKKFISGVKPDNGPSLRVNEKLGFVDTGVVADGERIFVLDCS